MSTHRLFDSRRWLPLAFLLLGLAGVWKVWYQPLGDFANYYYGARFMNKADCWQVYDVHRFNQAVEAAGQPGLFLDHTSVPPQTPLFYKPLAAIADPFLARGVFNAVGVVVFAFLLWRLLRAYPPAKNSYALLLLVAAAFPVYQNLAFGQTYLFITALLMAAWLAQLRGRMAMAGLWLAVAVALKLTPVVLLLFFVVRRQWRPVVWCLVFWAGITGLSMLVAGTDVFRIYYVHLLPRILDGYLNDPYSASYHGWVVLLRHLGQFDAVLNPEAPFAFSPQLIVLLNAVLLLPLFILVLLRIDRQQLKSTQGWLLLLVFLNIGSGYSSTYSLLVLVPFALLFSEGNAPLIRTLLLVGICLLPPRLLEHAPVVLQHYKFWLLLLVFFLTAGTGLRPVRLSPVIFRLTLLFIGLQAAKAVFLPKQLPMTYYSQSLTKYDYIQDYQLTDSAFKINGYGVSGKTTTTLPYLTGSYCALSGKPDPVHNRIFIGPGNHLFRTLVCDDKKVIFLCDQGRGVGLFHLFTMPREQFPFDQLR